MPGDVCRKIKAVDISSVLAALAYVRFVAVNIGSRNPAKSPCSVSMPGARLPHAIEDFVAGLELGGESRRILLRKLAPWQGMPVHVDQYLASEASWRRFQVPLVSHPHITMGWPDDGVEMHLAPGWLYEVRVDRPHEVAHRAGCERIHLQIDQIDATI